MASSSLRNDRERNDKTALGDDLRRTMRALVEARKPDPGLAATKRKVRIWQNKRFAKTYADLLVQPRYAPAVEFFLNELYGEVDLAARDADLMRVLPLMVKLLPAGALETIRDALAFERLGEQLDADVARHLGSTRLDVRTYGEAFRKCGQPALRRTQIDRVVQIGQELDRLTRWPMVSATLRMMRAPASSAGVSALHGFLDRGFTAFKHIRGADDFLATIARRETVIVERLFAAHPRPFELEEA